MSPQEGEVPQIEYEDINALDLQLTGPPILDNLVVLIRDPLNAGLYWHRRINVSPGSVDSSSGKKIQYVDVNRIIIDVVDRSPIPEEHLDVVIRGLQEGEKLISFDKDPDVKKLHSVVGIARYNGRNNQTLSDLVRITGLKYHKMRAAALS